MFSQDDADCLRASLPDLQQALAARLTSTNAESSKPCTAQEHLIRRYNRHYGLSPITELGETKQFFGQFQSEEFQLVCQYFLPHNPVKGTVFLFHGYYDHAGLYGHLIRYCLSLNLNVVIFDLPGHGLSGGETAAIKNFESYTQALIRCAEIAQECALAKPWHLVGQSTGAAVIVDYLLSFQPRQSPQLTQAINENSFEKSILLGPLLRPRGWMLGQLILPIARLFSKHLPRKPSDNSNDEAFLDFLRNQDQLQSTSLSLDWVHAAAQYQQRFKQAPVSQKPICVIQGDNDGTVDWKYNLPQLKHKFPKTKIVMIEGAKHHLVNELADYRQHVFSAIGDELASN